MKNFDVIAFDADDTLWANEPIFEDIEKKFCGLMEDFLSHQSIASELFRIQINNLNDYGYGIKGYILSMIETAIEISGKSIPIEVIEQILAYGKAMLQHPVELIDGVEETLKKLSKQYKLIVATKGDLKDQHRKLHQSGLGVYFHHIEVMMEKEDLDYQKLLNRIGVEPEKFLMIGNSLKSDVLPVLNIGGTAIHIPFHTTWAHERINHTIQHPKFYTLNQITALKEFLEQ